MGWYRNWRTSTKLISAFLVMALLIGAIGLYGLINLANINNNARVMYEDVMTGINELQDVQQEYLNIRIIIRDYITATSNAEREDTLIRLEQTKERLDQKVQTYKLRDLPEAVDREFSEFDASWVTYQETLQETVALADAGRNEELELLFDGSMRILAEKIDGIIANTVSAAMQIAADTNQANAKAFNTSRLVTIIVIVFGIALSIGLGMLISGLISKPLGRVVELVSKVSKGDLRETIDIQSKDEVGQLAEAVNRMVDGLRDTINNILMSAQSVSAASEQISASTEEIASGSSNQANAAQTINELFKELSEAIQSVAENTEQASELSEQTVEIAGRGNAVVQASMKSMTTVSEQMSKLNSESERIGDIIQVIEDIADQTNLLALNAAIEAARAGEQGRGFAVVADEVRKLAERSGEATKQITTIIKGMQENMHQSVNAVQESVELSNQTGESFQEITSILDVSGEKIAEIASASEEQAAQAHNVLQSVESISAVTEETAASSQETASTAQSLAKLADDLQTSVAVFKLR